MDKKFELLKINHESSNSAILPFLISGFTAYLSANIMQEGPLKNIVYIIAILLFTCSLAILIKNRRDYLKLVRYLESDY